MPDTKGRKKAVALAYDSSIQDIPKVLAKGEGSLAQAIIKKAEAFDINIFSNKALVNSLMQLELDEDIPLPLYQSVAELFAWLASIET